MRCFGDVFEKNIDVDIFDDVLQNAKHRANDASNDVNRPPLADALCPIMTRNRVCRKPYTIHRETEFGAALWMTSVLHSHTRSTKSLPLSRTCLMCLWSVMMRRKSVTYRRSLKGLSDVVSYLNKWCFRQTHGQTTILSVF